MWSDAFLEERVGGGVFNNDKNKDGKDNNDKDDKEDNNSNTADIWAGALHWVSTNGGETQPNVVRCLPGRGRKVTPTRMMMICHVYKDVDKDVGKDMDSNNGSSKAYINNGHSMRYWGWTRVPYPVVLLCLKTS